MPSETAKLNSPAAWSSSMTASSVLPLCSADARMTTVFSSAVAGGCLQPASAAREKSARTAEMRETRETTFFFIKNLFCRFAAAFNQTRQQKTRLSGAPKKTHGSISPAARDRRAFRRGRRSDFHRNGCCGGFSPRFPCSLPLPHLSRGRFQTPDFPAGKAAKRRAPKRGRSRGRRKRPSAPQPERI